MAGKSVPLAAMDWAEQLSIYRRFFQLFNLALSAGNARQLGGIFGICEFSGVLHLPVGSESWTRGVTFDRMAS